jgi:undecaprenyl phosphate-alpha-L-ara4N flippase subunit ArnE
MTGIAIALCLICQLLLVSGQLFLKRGMKTTPIHIAALADGTALLAGWFFIWLGLLTRWDLSRLFPFEGLNPALVVLGAWLFLKERVPKTAWIGIVLITLGVTLVAGS